MSDTTTIIKRVARWTTIVVVSLVFLFPLYWTVTRSLMTQQAAFRLPPVWIPVDLTIDAYTSILLDGPYLDYLVNSTVATSIAVVLSLILGVPATYALVRFEFPYELDKHMSFFLLSLFMLPPVVPSLSYYEIFQTFNLFDTSIGLGLAYTVFNLPLVVWFARGFVTDVPDSIREAALIDGATEFEIFRYIFLPLIRPGIAAAAIISFILTWNEYLLALVLTSSAAQTMPVGITEFVGQYAIAWNELSAGLVLVTLPGIVFIVFTQKYIIGGLTQGAIKE